MRDKSIALLLIDIQNGFMPDGELPVVEGDEIIPVVNEIVDDYQLVVASQDWHPKNHLSFADNHQNKSPFEIIDLNGLEQVLWPEHCVAGSKSAELHANLKQTNIASIFRKGMNSQIDSYSAFYDNGHRHNTGLEAYLKFHDITHIHMAGLAADYCVYYTIKDALTAGFEVTLFDNATRAIDIEQFNSQKNQLRENDKFHLELL